MPFARYLSGYTIFWRWSQNFTIDLGVSGVSLADYRVVFNVSGHGKSFTVTSDDLLEIDIDNGTVQAELNSDSQSSDGQMTFGGLTVGMYDYFLDFLKAKDGKFYSDFSLQGKFQSLSHTGQIQQAGPVNVGATITLASSAGFIATLTVHGWDEGRVLSIEAKNKEQDDRLDALEGDDGPNYVEDTESLAAQVRIRGEWQEGYNKSQIDSSQGIQDLKIDNNTSKNLEQDGRLSAAETNISTNQSDIATNKTNITTNADKNTEQDDRLTSLEQQAHEGFTPVGVWNANTNVPDLINIDPAPTNGNYWLVEVAGDTVLNNHSGWEVGDWAIWLADVPGNWEQYRPPNSAQQDIDNHKLDEGNPHGVTAAQTGADPAGSADAVDSRLTTEVTRLDAKDSAQDTALTTHTDDSAIHWNEARIAALESAVSTLQSDLAAHTGNALIHFGDAPTGDDADYLRFNRTWASRVTKMHTISVSSNTPIAVPDGTFVQIASVTIDRLSYGGIFGFDGMFIPDGNQSRVLEVDLRIDGISTGNVDSLLIGSDGVHYTIAGGFDNDLPVGTVISIWAQFLTAAGSCESHNMSVSTTYLDTP